ncbi:DNA-binding Xre family transcriptional regulator [Paucibacter oligotrophus]|uniref:DNA-binding Xre family transcriptional regulator n=1 Tax=Roseateles oligotrophus TaxID=1769250 RepID=A0A840L5U3_9BURK|nr:helix-turn-helix domain-containing protein [Roseateles oligotrophus]MBB4841935.1 DNA-binding Xre family transcriptional regulator [Roseateles oligotrophus]
MSTPEVLLQVLRSEMRVAGLTYKGLGDKLGLSESSIKRMFSQGDMSLTRMAQICKAVGVAMDDVLRQAADATPHADTLTLEQEKSLVSDPKLLLVAISCLGHWTMEQIVETYEISETECIGYLVKLDRLALIELKPGNRYRMRVSLAFRWLPDGPVQHFFRRAVVDDYFAGRFDGQGESLLCVHARLSDASAMELVHKIRQLAGELARLHQDDQRLPLKDRDGYTLMLGFRSWEFRQLTAMRRKA